MNVFWIIGAVVAVMLAEYILFARLGLRRVQYRRSFSKDFVYEGEHLEMVEVISNLKLLPLPWLRVEARMAGSLVFDKEMENLDVVDDLYHNSLFALGPYKRITRRHDVQAMRRGYYVMPSVSLSAGDVLGLTGSSQTRDVETVIAVYPSPLGYEHMQVDSHRWQGDVIMRRYIEPDPFLINGIRAWQTGDSLKDVHWPATARMGGLQVKTRDFTASPKLLILFNIQTAEDQWGESLDTAQAEVMEYGVRLSATYVTWAQENHVEFAFASNGRYGIMDETPVSVPPGAGQVQYHAVMEALARLRFSRRMGFPSLLDEVIASGLRDTDVVVISQYWSDYIQERAETLRHMGNSVRWNKLDKDAAAQEAAAS